MFFKITYQLLRGKRNFYQKKKKR